jgi:methyl-accepting chemotaxis protein
MSVLSRFNVGTKLAVGFGALLAALAVVGLFAIHELKQISEGSRRIVTENVTGVREALMISDSATRYRVREFRLALTKQEDRAGVIKRLQAALDTISEHRKKYESAISDDQERTLYKNFSGAFDRYLVISRGFQDRALAGDDTGAQQVLLVDSLKPFDAVVEATKALSKYNDELAQAASERAAAMASRANWLILAVLATALVAGALLAWSISRAITRPLRKALGLAEGVAAGDLTHSLRAEGSDEVTQLTRALSSMVDKLRVLVSEVRLGVESVSSASSEIATGNHDLSARTEQAAANLQQTAASMEQLTGTVSTSADTARQANQLADRATDAAQRGGQVVGQVVANMEQITNSSKKINDIIGVIDGIAFQTNILALNAAVEAARAGEQGRGFAVVASEVRTLAQRSATAAKEIKTLIGASVETVESGAQLVQDAGTVMQDIISSVQRVSDLMGELAAASGEQREGIDQVNTAVGNLDQMTQQNAALVEESAAAATSLHDQAKRLNDVVSVFNLGGGSEFSVPTAAPQPVARKAPEPAKPSPSRAVAVKPAAAQAPAPALAAPAAAARPAATANEADWETF